jgi:D-arabinitol 2-dehydrogenase
MLRPAILRQTAKSLAKTTSRALPNTLLALRPASITSRTISTTPRLLEEDKYKDASTGGKAGALGDHEGQYARTDKKVRVEYPEEHEFPPSKIVQGRGGMHFKRTLPSFSLEDRVAMITGGARGLGLVMTQALVASGADVAIIDLNSLDSCHLYK